MADHKLDSPQACQDELSAVNQRLGEFGHEWAENAGKLKQSVARYERFYRAGMRGIHTGTVQEREATAHAAVDGYEEGLAEKIEELEGKVESHKTEFKTLERRASNAQSVLSALKNEARIPVDPDRLKDSIRRAA